MNASDFSWFHAIDLKDGTVTRSDFSDGDAKRYDLIRKVRNDVSYEGKKVLDIASWDGLWAFEAEDLGASMVVATDVPDLSEPRDDISGTVNKLLYARQKRESKVVPYFDVSIHALSRLLPFCGGPFDIIQNLGVLYHLENPWHALKECRRVIKTGGHMIIETACDSSDDYVMRINRGKMFYSPDFRTYWAPSIPCLCEMLKATFFEPIMPSVRVLSPKSPIVRMGMVAIAVEPPKDVSFDQRGELNNGYRNL